MKNNLRILLLVLTLLFIATAFSIRKSISDTDILELDTKHLTENLRAKEKLVDHIFADSLYLKTFVNSDRYPLQLKEISQRYEEENVYLYLYKNKKPIFWSSNMYVPETEAGLKNETSFIKTENFSFVVKKKKISDEISVLALIPIERSFNASSGYFKTTQFFSFLKTDNLRFANLGDSENIKNIYAKDNTFLFSVKLKEGKHNSIFLKIQLICWILGTLCFVIWVNGACLTLARRGYPFLSVIILLLTFFLVRIIDIETNWFTQYSSLDIFDPRYYAYSYLSPNLWSFLINNIAIFWILCFAKNIKDQWQIPNKLKQRNIGVLIYYLLLSALYICFHWGFDQITTLITHSPITHKDFVQIFYLNPQTFIHALIYSLSILSLIYLTDLILGFGKAVCHKATLNINIQLITIVQFLILGTINQDFSLFNVLVGVLIMVRSFDYSMFKDNNLSTHVVSLVALALISTIKYAEAVKETQQEQMKITLTTLESDDDIEAISRFSDIEYNLQSDQQLKHLIEISLPNPDTKMISEYIKRKYLGGYLSKYEFRAYYYYNETPLGKYAGNKMDEYREKVINKSIKVNETDLFYKVQTEIGTYEYFCIVTFPVANEQNISVILDFKSKAFNPNFPFPVLTESQSEEGVSPQRVIKDSFALYKNGNLITQNGKYTYPNSDNSYPQKTHEFLYLDDNNGFYHIIYKPNKETTIIVSKPHHSYWQYIAVASVAFLTLYLALAISKFLLVIIPKYLRQDFKLRNISYQVRIILSRIRYSTRIQTLVISSVLIAIVISGLITFFSVSYQSQKNIESQRLNYISELVTKLETRALIDTVGDATTDLKALMTSMSDVLITDFNLYDKNGKLFFTTQPKIYDQKLVSEYINPDAFITLNVLKKTETQNNESIADFNYVSSYATIRNSNYHTIAYLGIPYFDSSAYDSENRSILLNTILNVYTIIIIVFVFLSVYISNKITEPLQIIRKKLSQTNLGGKQNEPLYWEKNDEIGVLVKEYNFMLVKLEENAKQLRNAERESAWREMAKQVAHEIKNPLTPMKLGIQQLSRSFYENDPRLTERFQKISTSFIQQIDALSHIASEFSAFAKLPDTNLVPIDLIAKINKSLDVYNNNQNTAIVFENHTKLQKIIVLGDRDQLLRSFNNLLKNAIEATSRRRKHKINIQAHLLEDNWVQIIVHDNGDGIARDVIPNIFSPNFTTKSSGTGLGLAFVKQTIDGMGGKITFQTEINIGTSFFIEIPLHKESL
ncbi:ATP-binding protein [Sphingobacterium yanglingense]|uniref:histidine kinase n=1 Tax=Sphingobacterium yanglingense TaxID=1437280 RepID=A0A4R6WRK9_9SPHI|nr:ATP-binding protein [Sphingobacterium yanglingense]TDQ81233.1 histidine kinase/DNA gyrase B/HSP90-like ATPase [Sphingobacterium yanglingense]